MYDLILVVVSFKWVSAWKAFIMEKESVLNKFHP